MTHDWFAIRCYMHHDSIQPLDGSVSTSTLQSNFLVAWWGRGKKKYNSLKMSKKIKVSTEGSQGRWLLSKRNSLHWGLGLLIRAFSATTVIMWVLMGNCWFSVNLLFNCLIQKKNINKKFSLNLSVSVSGDDFFFWIGTIWIRDLSLVNVTG